MSRAENLERRADAVFYFAGFIQAAFSRQGLVVAL